VNTGILDEIAQAQAGNAPRSYAGGFDPATARRGPADDQLEGQKQLRELMRVWYDRLLGDPAKSMAAVGDMLRGGLQGPPSGGRYDEMMRPVDPQGVPTGQPSVTDLVDHIQQAMSLYAGPGIVKGMASRPMTNVTPFGAYHGTPNRWGPEPSRPHGRPRLDKIGTGEGAQAYGYGWYSADRKDVGELYHTVLSSGKDYTIKFANRSENIPSWLAKRIEDDPKYIDEAIADFSGLLTKTQAQLDSSLQPWLVEMQIENIKKIVDALNGAKAAGAVEIESPGALYKLDIPDDVAPKLLDWDAPVSERVMSKIENGLFDRGVGKEELDEAINYYKTPGEGISGGQAYKAVARVLEVLDKENDPLWWYRGGDQASASDFFRSIGIPGNKYFDGSSRGKGDGTRNYVIWDQDVLDRVKILERNSEKLGDTP
jgi:hypothetical protein